MFSTQRKTLCYVRKKLEQLKNPKTIEVYECAERMIVHDLWKVGIYVDSKNKLHKIHKLNAIHMKHIVEKYKINTILIEVQKNDNPRT